jgi:katanin p60 ATPase-containing subunit A1
VPLPTKEAKKQMIESLIPSQKIPNIDTLSLANRLENYSGSDIRLLCKEASMKPIRRLMRQLENMDENMTMNWHVPAEPTSIPAPGGITVQDFEEALINTKPSSQIKQGAYEEWFSQYGSV